MTGLTSSAYGAKTWVVSHCGGVGRKAGGGAAPEGPVSVVANGRSMIGSVMTKVNRAGTAG